MRRLNEYGKREIAEMAMRNAENIHSGVCASTTFKWLDDDTLVRVRVSVYSRDEVSKLLDKAEEGLDR